MIEIAPNDNLLNAALSAGIAWPHNCRVGSCGTCRCKLVSGKIKPLNDFSYVLDGDELDAGMILACQTRAKSDIEVRVVLDPDTVAIPAEAVSGNIARCARLTHDILEISIKLDKPLPAYFAGQYAEISIDGIEQPRSYSFARAPTRETPDQVSFFVRLVPGGKMSTWLHQESEVGTPVTVNGPMGSFYLRSSTTPMLCIAGGSGLAPIKSLLEQLDQDGFSRPVKFLFGARTQEDLYCIAEMEAIESSNKELFEFIPVLSEELTDTGWSGPRGMVTEHIQSQGFDLSSSQAYLCGPPPMIDSAIKVLNQGGMNSDQIFFDKFLDASHLPGGKR